MAEEKKEREKKYKTEAERKAARAESIKKHRQKTYKQLTFFLRIEDDAAIISEIEEAAKNGINKREWLCDLYFRANMNE